jgi:beta-lactamase class A
MRSTGFFGNQMPTTASDMALLLEAIARGAALNEATSLEMLARLESEVIDDRIPALLPAGTFVAHKTGSWSDATHDAGIVISPEATYVLVILTDYGYADGGAERIALVSRAVYDYYND